MSTNKNFNIKLISFNAMSAFSFDSLHGFISSINVFERQKKIAEILKEQNPDIITLQEVHTYPILKLLKSRLTSYPFVAYKRYIYGPRGGLVTFSKLPIVGVEYIDFKKRGSFLNSSFIAHIIKNGVLTCKISDSNLIILNTHITPNLDHDYSKRNRFIKYIDAQLKQISEVVNELADRKMSVIAAGDFNVAKNSASYKKFLQSSKLHDAFSNYQSPTQHQEFLPKHKLVRRIDYVFMRTATSGCKINSIQQLFTEKFILKKSKLRYLSDHIGLEANLSFDA